MAISTGALRASLGQALPGLNLKSGEIASLIRKAVINGWSNSQLLLSIYGSQSFKRRFPGIRDATSRALLMSPGDYINQENQLRLVMRRYGVHPSFYNQASDLGKYIVRGITADDLDKRFQLAHGLLADNPRVVAEMQRLYHLTKQEAKNGAAFLMLEPTRSQQWIDKAITTAQISDSARRAGFAPFDRKFVEGLATSGVSAEQANQAFMQAGLDRQQLRTFAARYHYGELSDAQIAGALFHPDPGVAGIRQQLFAQEASQFRAGAGFAMGQGGGVAGLQTTEAADR